MWDPVEDLSVVTNYKELKKINHHPNLQSEALVPSTPTVDMEMLKKSSKTMSTIAILWPVKVIFEKRAATVEVDTLTSPEPTLRKSERSSHSFHSNLSSWVMLVVGCPELLERNLKILTKRQVLSAFTAMLR